ncbi:clan AA aspartic protease [Mucilaginibacter robiniae]|uniref:Clan AA aspartic protease n=1 Tax=Mucilaginibacter robiniae TaxID=2728022 RepID=A0A7L5E1Y0_9SPHI|nr:retropepsin-like aspartic protease [Mucilaginibacter robiniae]QJD95604.1 clan AA aspartic protease [Mucilaginibacter robiniae]
MSIVLTVTKTSYAQPAVPFEITSQGHIVVKAKINGVEGNFIFDTGAGLTLVTKNFANKLGTLHKQDGSYTSFRATGEPLTANLYDVESVALGSFTEQHAQLTIFNVNLGPIDGLISLMSFRKQPFTIDYIHKKIIFETDKSLAAIHKKAHVVPLQLEISRDKALDVFAYFTVNNKLTLQFLIDSGSGMNIYRLNTRYITPLGIDTVNATKTTHPSEFNPKVVTAIYNANVQSIVAKSSAAVACQNVKASFIDGLIYDGVVSLNWIGKQITFDLKKQEMLVW